MLAGKPYLAWPGHQGGAEFGPQISSLEKDMPNQYSYMLLAALLIISR